MRSVKKVVALALVLIGCSKTSLSASDCDAMLDRYVDMTEDDDPALAGLPSNEMGEPRAGVRRARVGERRASMAYLNAEKRCTLEVTAKEHACAMKAPSPNEWEACFEYH
jgi:hypothetical protein